jgi:hypothetical protein
MVNALVMSAAISAWLKKIKEIAESGFKMRPTRISYSRSLTVECLETTLCR